MIHLLPFAWILLVSFINCAAVLESESDSVGGAVDDSSELMPTSFLSDFRYVALQAPRDPSYPRRIRDLFLRSPGDNVPQESALELLGICQKVARNLAGLPAGNRSFDDLLLFAFLEKFAHRLVQLHDRTLSKSKQLNFGRFRISKALQDALFSSNSSAKVNNFFDYRNFALFKRTFDKHFFYHLGDADAANIAFLKPENFYKEGKTEFTLFEKIYANPDTVMQNILRSQALKISRIVSKMKNNESVPSDERYNWKLMNTKLANYLAVLTVGQEALFPDIPHYYLYTDTLQSIRMALLSRNGIDFVDERPFWAASLDLSNPERISLNALPRLTADTPVILRWRVLTEEMTKFDFNVWFNYIKSARTAKIFDYPSFQYITDHLLNVPKFLLFPGGSEVELMDFGCNENWISAGQAGDIVEEMVRLLNLTLNEVNYRKSRRDLLVSRAVNISVLVTRFISRIKASSTLLSVHALADLYNIIVPFTTSIELDDVEMSRLHFALSHICFVVPDHEQASFTQLINLEVYSGINKNCRTLQKYHWFRAQVSYSYNRSVADDQFNYGMGVESDVECDFLKSLLVVDFLKVSHFAMESVKFDFSIPDDHSIKVSFTDLHDEVDKYLIINLSTGAINHEKKSYIEPVAAQEELFLPFLPQLETTKSAYLGEFIIHPALTDSGYINLSTVYSQYYAVNNFLLTSGYNVGVSINLISDLEHNLEGSHLLVARRDAVLKVLLISSAQANKIAKDKRMANRGETSLWICDLSGSVTWSTAPFSEKDNILTVIPATRKLIFDALIFNGSLPQILANRHLNKIYCEQWIIRDASLRANFMLNRMKEVIFDEFDPEYMHLIYMSKQEPTAIIEYAPCDDDYEFDIYETEDEDDIDIKNTFNNRKFGGTLLICAGCSGLILVYFAYKNKKFNSVIETDFESDSEDSLDSLEQERNDINSSLMSIANNNV